MSVSVAYCFVARHFISRRTEMTYHKTFFCFRTVFTKNVLSQCTFAFALVIFFSECKIHFSIMSKPLKRNGNANTNNSNDFYLIIKAKRCINWDYKDPEVYCTGTVGLHLI